MKIECFLNCTLSATFFSASSEWKMKYLKKKFRFIHNIFFLYYLYLLIGMIKEHFDGLFWELIEPLVWNWLFWWSFYERFVLNCQNTFELGILSSRWIKNGCEKNGKFNWKIWIKDFIEVEKYSFTKLIQIKYCPVLSSDEARPV